MPKSDVRQFFEMYLLDFEVFEINENEFEIDCGGCDFEFIKLINIISENIEEWTYDCMFNLRDIEINLCFEKVIFKF